MAHYAKVDEDGTVVEIIVADASFIERLQDRAQWYRTSYNTFAGKHYSPDDRNPDNGHPFRKNFATIGGRYDQTRDAFIPPQDFPSWLIDEETCRWIPPIVKPDNENVWVWDEERFNNGQDPWIDMTGQI